MMSVFEDVQRNRVEINQETRKVLRDHLSLIDGRFRRSAKPNAAFLQILGGPDRVYETLVDMH